MSFSGMSVFQRKYHCATSCLLAMGSLSHAHNMVKRRGKKCISSSEITLDAEASSCHDIIHSHGAKFCCCCGGAKRNSFDSNSSVNLGRMFLARKTSQLPALNTGGCHGARIALAEASDGCQADRADASL